MAQPVAEAYEGPREIAIVAMAVEMTRKHCSRSLGREAMYAISPGGGQKLARTEHAQYGDIVACFETQRSPTLWVSEHGIPPSTTIRV